MKVKDYPEWVLKHKEKWVEIRHINGRFTANRYSSVWDPVKKRSKKITGEYLGVITPEGLIPPKNRLTSLKENDKTLRNLQILKELESGKRKSDLAKKYDITTKTINNIKERFEKDGLKGLIHTREDDKEIIKISSPEQAAIVTDLIQNPNKDSKEIKNSLGIKTSIKKIENIINPIKDLLKLKKKLLLEIER